MNIAELLNIPFLRTVVWGNSLETYVVTAAIWFGGFTLLYVLKRMGVKRFENWLDANADHLDIEMFSGMERSLMALLRLAIFTVGYTQLALSKTVQLYADRLLVVVTVFIVTTALIRFITLTMDMYLRRRGETLEEYKGRAILPIFKGIIWMLGFVFILDNFGFEVTSILAGLGVAGIAVGLAAQAVLGDLFSYFAILMDRPFRIGDFIIVDTFMGTLEHVGLKTSRLRSLGGEQIIMSNSDLTNSRVRNYRRMRQRRVLMTFGVIYQTKADQLEAIPGMVKNIIDNTARTTFDRAHFFRFGESSLDFEVVYYVQSPEMNVHMEIQEKIMLALVRRFEAEGIDFAYPTRTLYVTNQPAVAPVATEHQLTHGLTE